MSVDPNLIVACGTVVIASVTAWGTRRANKKLTTGNGKDIGKYVADIALALLAADAKVDKVAEDLTADRADLAADRAVMREHIDADQAFQTRVEPFLLAAPVAAAAVAAQASGRP